MGAQSMFMVMLAALSAAMAVYLRGLNEKSNVGVVVMPFSAPERTKSRGRWQVPGLGTIGEARLLELLDDELDSARHDGRPVGLMLVAPDFRTEVAVPHRERHRALSVIEAALREHVTLGSLFSRVGDSKFAVISASLDAPQELQDLAEKVHQHVWFNRGAASLSFDVMIGGAISSQSRMYATGIFHLAKTALQRADTTGLHTYFAVDRLQA
jgi:GGDEF domain-containing protein